MSDLNPKYLIAPSLQEVFRDKDTGLPLSNGYVSFWSDNSRITPKPIFTLTGNPGNYTYVQLENPVPLTSIGTLSDGFNNDIIPYYFPFDDDGNIDLYFIQVYNSGNELQFTRQAWPNLSLSGSNVENIFNYIANGQFSLHNDIPANPVLNYPAGRVTQQSTVIGEGGWTFERPSGSTAIDIVTFDRIGSYVTNPTASPRYAIRVNTQSAGSGDNFKYLQCKFDDVNKFASDTQQYTFSLSGINNAAGSIDVTILFIKNFGTGGSPTVIETLATFSIGTSYQIFQTTFIPGDNAAYSIGPNNDDYCALVVSFQTSFSQDISLTNFILASGDVNIVQFPIISNEDFISRSNITLIPAYDGSNVGLPVIQTQRGLDYDRTVVGEIVSSTSLITKDWYHLCDGSKYITSLYQSTGAPNSRLQQALFDTTSGQCIYGSGADYCNMYNSILSNNSSGTVSSISDGTVPTGFTFTVGYQGINSSGYSYGSTGYSTQNPSSGFIILNNAVGTFAPVGIFASNVSLGQFFRNGSTVSAQASCVIFTGVPNAGGYITFQNAVLPTTGYVLWFTVDGSGSAPSIPGFVNIQVNLLSTLNTHQISFIASSAVNNTQTTIIGFSAAGTITPGSYFNFQVIGGTVTNYYVWYTVGGVGTDPAPIGSTGIKVVLVGTETAAQVESLTKIAVNSYSFSVPVGYGQFLRMQDPTSLIDTTIRVNKYTGSSILIGSYQLDSNVSHSHTTRVTNSSGSPDTSFHISSNTFIPSPPITFFPTSYDGNQETVTKNIAVNYFIRY